MATLATERAEPEEPAVGATRRRGRFGRELAYLLGGLPVGLAAFTIAVTGFALGVSTFVVVLGLPVLVGTLAVARGFARGERARVSAMTGRAVPEPAYRTPESDDGGLTRMLRSLRDWQSWRDLAHMVLSFPLRVVTFSVVLTWTLGAAGGLLYGVWSWALPRDHVENGLVDLLFDTTSQAADIGFNTAIGVVLAATAVPVVRGLAALQTGFARAWLSNPAPAHLR